MTKIFLKYHPVETSEQNPNQIFEEFKICRLCETSLLTEYFADDQSELCLFCHKEKKISKNLQLFTFKNIFLFLSKFGFDIKSLSKLESRLVKIMMKEEYFNYHNQNMVWYLNLLDVENMNQVKKTLDFAYDHFCKIEFLEKQIWHIHHENLKGQLLNANINSPKIIMPNFYESNPYFQNQAAKYLNRSHIFS